MNIFKKFVNHIKGSQLVEKVLMVAFSVAAGGAVIVYGVNVINQSKTVDVSLDGIVVATNSSGVQLITGQKYTFNPIAEPIDMHHLSEEDMEYFSIRKLYLNGEEHLCTWGANPVSYNGFIGYSSWNYDDSTGEYFLDINEDPCLSFILSDEGSMAVRGHTDPAADSAHPRLTQTYFDTSFDRMNFRYGFEFSGTYVRRGNGPCLLDYLTYYEE